MINTHDHKEILNKISELKQQQAIYQNEYNQKMAIYQNKYSNLIHDINKLLDKLQLPRITTITDEFVKSIDLKSIDLKSIDDIKTDNLLKTINQLEEELFNLEVDYKNNLFKYEHKVKEYNEAIRTTLLALGLPEKFVNQVDVQDKERIQKMKEYAHAKIKGIK